MAATPGADARRDALTDPHLLEAILGRCQPSLSNARDAGTTGCAIAGVNRLFRRVALERLPWAADIDAGRVASEGAPQAQRALAAWANGRRLQTLVLDAAGPESQAQADACAALLECTASTLVDLRVDCVTSELFGGVCRCAALTRLDLAIAGDECYISLFSHQPTQLQGSQEHDVSHQLAALVHLRELSLASGLWGGVQLGWLTELRQLTYLSLLNYAGPGVPGTAVRRLKVDFTCQVLEYFHNDEGRFCLAEWASPHLSCLVLGQVSVVGPLPGAQTARVPALKELELESFGVRPGSLSSLCEGGVHLTRLRLDGEAVDENRGCGLPASLRALELDVYGEAKAVWLEVFALQALTALQVTACYFCQSLEEAQQWALGLAAGLSGMPSLAKVALEIRGWRTLGPSPGAARELVEPSFDGLKGLLAARGGHADVDIWCGAPGCTREAG